jgi:hypothetical protein
MLKIRSNVYIIPNAHGGIYEATDNPDIMRVNLEQTIVWWEGDKLKRTSRRVDHLTDLALLRKGSVLPGNICVAYQTDPVLEDEPEQYFSYDENGEIEKTPEGWPVYTYYYYAPLSRYKSTGDLEDDDVIEHLTMPSSI